MAKKEKRFVKIHEEGGVFSGVAVFVDKETGVNYLFVQSSEAGGLTPLLDRDGKPVISTVSELDD